MTAKYYDNEQPRQLFLDTVVDFYEKLGSKDWWKNLAQQLIDLEALSQDYIRTDHTGFKDEDSNTLHSVIEEYHMRAKYVARIILKEANNERI